MNEEKTGFLHTFMLSTREMEKAGLAVDAHMVLTDLGIEKKPAQPDLIGDAKKAVDKVRATVAAF